MRICRKFDENENYKAVQSLQNVLQFLWAQWWLPSISMGLKAKFIRQFLKNKTMAIFPTLSRFSYDSQHFYCDLFH